MSKNQEAQHNVQEQPTAPRFRMLAKTLLRRVENTIFGLILIIVSLYFLLQMPAVQNWLVAKVTTYLSQEWETTVALQRVDLEFFDNLVLEGLYVEDVKGDTLLYAGKVSAGIKSNFFAFLGKEVVFSDINLSNARLFIHKSEGEIRNTLSLFLSKIAGNNTKKQTSKSIVLRVQNLLLNDVVILRDVETNNKRNPKVIDREKHLFKIPFGQIRINAIDLDNDLIDVASVHLDGLTVDLEESERPATLNPPVPTTPVSKSIQKAPTPPIVFKIGTLMVTNGHFEMDKYDASPTRSSLLDVMDYDHLNVRNIVLQGENFSFNDEFNNNNFKLSGTIKHLAAQEDCGFSLVHAEVGQLSLTDTMASLVNTKIQTNNTSLGDTIQFKYSGYRDFRSFEDSVDMDIRLNLGSQLQLSDLRYFDKNIAENEFFKTNATEITSVKALIHGKVDRLRADNLELRLGNSTYIACDFRGNGLNSQGTQTLNFAFKELRTDVNTIGRIIPGFKPPDQFRKLGSIAFKGDYQLFDGIDHVLYGDISTDLGSGRADMQLNLKAGKEKAVYSGGLEMKHFDLATWTGDQNFGRSTFRVKIAENSTGLTLPTIKAKITGKIDTLSYRGYSYRNISLDGSFREKIFEGVLNSGDPNVDFTFDGTINLKEAIPRFEFSANLRRLDLGVLNLTDNDLVLAGDIENLSLQGKSLDEITGSATLRHFKLLQDREEWHRIDSLQFFSSVRADGSRVLGFNSDIAKCALTGNFNLNNLPQHLASLMQQYYPAFASRFGIKEETPNNGTLNDNYELQLQIRDSKNFTKIFSDQLDTLRNLNLSVRVNAKIGSSDILLEAPAIKFAGITFHDPSFRWNSLQDSAWYSLRLPGTKLSSKQNLPPILFSGQVFSDELHFTLEASEENSLYLENLFLKGTLSTVDSLWQVRFNTSKISMFSQEWRIADENYIRFGPNYIETRAFEFFNGNQRISLEGGNKGRGINFSLTNFNLQELNHFLDPESLVIGGNIYDFDISVQDVFQMQGMEVSLLTDTLFLNGRPYGMLSGNVEMENLTSPLFYKLFLQNEGVQRLRLAGAWLPNTTEPFYSEVFKTELKSGELFAVATIHALPFEIVEIFIPDISKTAGYLDANLELSGTPDGVGASGNVHITEGQFQIDYLKSMFYLKNQAVSISKNKIEVTNDTIWDASQLHMAIVQGSLEHEYFKKWRVNCTIESLDRAFMILNTTAEDNELYYGQGIGYFKLLVTGSFTRTNMVIDATTGKDTRLYIPLSSTSDAKEVSFIKFTNKGVEKKDPIKNKAFTFTDLKGLNFEMNLTVTDDAEVQLIFDEQAGDIIKSRGEGDIKLSINREGEFKMYGGYRVLRGEYLFTLLNFVNKPFTLVTGGTINWFGDPYGAQLNLDAKYDQNTAVYNFIRDEVELLTNVKDEASKATRVVVTMHINGDLLKPDISFGLEFPNITTQLKSLTDNKLRLIRQDQSELSRQIFGLIVIGSFLPSNTEFVQSSDYVASAFNTFTQMISNQFSNYLAGLAAEWFKNDVSSIDLDIVYSDYQNVLSDPSQSLAAGGRELQVRLKSGFINDKITVQVGSQFGLGGRTNLPISNGLLGEDVSIEIRLTENNQWRLKVYQRTEPDISGQRRDRYGLGVSFQKDYDSFNDMWKGFGHWIGH
jgi:hypothetical protein